MTHQPFVCIVIVNWNGWESTIECLESVFQMEYTNFCVVVCDNASQDGSLQYLKLWADGKLDSNPLINPTKIKGLISEAIQKPIPYLEINQDHIQSVQNIIDGVNLILIQANNNLGFAGGSNIGIRFALNLDKIEYIWLLNNDTVVKKNTLREMVKKLEANPRSGICGSTVLYYYTPEIIQALGGGTYNKWLGKTELLGTFQTINKPFDIQRIIDNIDFVLGASMLIRRETIIEIGLLNEVYFLYFEELDYAKRIQKKYLIDYASKSFVYHKEGESIGTSSQSNTKERSVLSDYFGIRNRLLFTQNFYPYTLPIIYLGIFGVILNRVKNKQWHRIPIIIKLLFYHLINLGKSTIGTKNDISLNQFELELIENRKEFLK